MIKVGVANTNYIEVEIVNLTLERENIREILNVTEEALKGIVKRKQLATRLKEKGYKLLETYKLGRSTIYEVEELSLDQWGDYQNRINIRDKAKHTKYCGTRIVKLSESCSKLASEVGVSKPTAKSWDKKLEEENVIKPLGYRYIWRTLDKEGQPVYTDINKDAYHDYWANNKDLRARKKFWEDQRDKRLSSPSKCDEMLHEIKMQAAERCGGIVYRFEAYTEGDMYKPFKDLLEGK